MKVRIPDMNNIEVERTGQIIKASDTRQLEKVVDKDGAFFYWPVDKLDALQEEQESATTTNEIVIIPAIDRLAEVDKYLEVFHLAIRSLEEDAMFRNLIKLRNELRVEVMQDANKIWGLKPE